MKPTHDELVKDYINLIYFFAKRWIDTKEDIQDAVQDIYIKIFKEYPRFTFKTTNELKSWLLKVSRSVVMDKYRKQKPILNLTEEIEESFEGEQNIDKWLSLEIEKEQLSAIHSEMKNLSIPDQEIIHLRLIENLSFIEIAIILGISEAGAKMRFYRTINNLKNQLI